jgi:hypothetical protein
VLYGEDEYTGNQIWCTSSIPGYEQMFREASKKETSGFLWNFQHGWEMLGASPLILLFGASILHQYKRRRTQVFNWLLFGSALVLIAANNIGVAQPEVVGPWNALIVLFPGMLVMGTSFFFILLDRVGIQIQLLNTLIVITLVALTLLPTVLTLTSTGNFYAFPPYMPPYIKSFGQYADTDEWVTSDLPWATAWYADRPSLWLPDSISEFENIHDTVCPTGILLLTPVSWALSTSTFTTGEYKDWLPFVVPSLPAPSGFPLTDHVTTPPGGPDYSLWSDRPRWQAR